MEKPAISEQYVAKSELHIKAYRPINKLIFERFNNLEVRKDLVINASSEFILNYATYERLLHESIQDVFGSDDESRLNASQTVFANHRFVSWRFNDDWPLEKLPDNPTYEQVDMAFMAKMIRNKSIGAKLTLMYAISIKKALKARNLDPEQTYKVLIGSYGAIEPLAFLHDYDEEDLMSEFVDLTYEESLFPGPEVIQKIYSGVAGLPEECWDVSPDLKVKFSYPLPRNHLDAKLEPRMSCPVAVLTKEVEYVDGRPHRISYLESMWQDVIHLMYVSGEFNH